MIKWMYIEVEVCGETFGYCAVRDHKTGKPKLNGLGSNSTIRTCQEYKTSNGRLIRRRIRLPRKGTTQMLVVQAILNKYQEAGA